MFNVHVTTQVDLALEGTRAEVTEKGTIGGVLAAVRDEIRRLTERLVA